MPAALPAEIMRKFGPAPQAKAVATKPAAEVKPTHTDSFEVGAKPYCPFPPELAPAARRLFGALKAVTK